MSSASKVSIVIINHNGREHLETCLNSLATQTYKSIEVILVDNGSSDGSVDYVKKFFSWVKVFESGINVGYALGCNIGASHANGESIIFLNTDVKMEPNWLEEFVKTAESDPSIGVCGCKVLRLDDKRIDCIGGFVVDLWGYGLMPVGHLEKDAGQYDGVSDVFAIAGMCMLVRKSVFEKVGGFDERFFLLVEDIDLCWRIRLAGYNIKVNPKAIIYHKSMATFKKEKITKPNVRLLVERNTLSTLIKNYGNKKLLIILPQNLSLLLVEIITFIFTGNLNLAISDVKAVIWNLRNLRSTLYLRKRVNQTRRVTDDTIQRKMIRKSLKVIKFRDLLKTL